MAAYARYVPVLGKPPGPMLDDYKQRVARKQVWVVEDEGALSGVLVLETGQDALLLDNVAVRPECQGRGLGRTLVSFAEAEAQRRGFSRVRLYTHVLMADNQALYRRLGFVETERRTEKGFARVYMEKVITAAR
jgi:ribosomal protein S18 acetylase RimI-like enzyme